MSSQTVTREPEFLTFELVMYPKHTVFCSKLYAALKRIAKAMFVATLTIEAKLLVR